jgi:hypothetical protein
MSFFIAVPVHIWTRRIIACFFKALHTKCARASFQSSGLACFIHGVLRCDEERSWGVMIRGNMKICGLPGLAWWPAPMDVTTYPHDSTLFMQFLSRYQKSTAFDPRGRHTFEVT